MTGVPGRRLRVLARRRPGPEANHVDQLLAGRGRFALGRQALPEETRLENSACQIDVYEVETVLQTQQDRKIRAAPKPFSSRPKSGRTVLFFKHRVDNERDLRGGPVLGGLRKRKIARRFIPTSI